MRFNPTRRLDVFRTLSDGLQVAVGTLAQDKSGVYFAYEADYLAQFGNLSPFALKADTRLQAAPPQPHYGLHGVFADSLPDGWGLLLQDRYFRQLGWLPQQISAMDRLAFVGNRGIGALSYQPAFDEVSSGENISLHELGEQAQAVFDGQTEEVLQALLAAGSSGGARPKAQIFMSADRQTCRTTAQAGDEAWIVKFTSANLPLGLEESLCEAAYLTMAQRAGLQPVEWALFDAPQGRKWLGVKRFDWRSGTDGRQHVHSASGLLGADFRLPSLDYDDLIKAAKLLCRSAAAARLQFARAAFNLFALNQDDHAKNFAFIQADNGDWSPSPLYDITFNPSRFGEHATAFGGHGKRPPKAAIEKLAKRAGFDNWAEVKTVLQQTADSLAGFAGIAKELGVKSSTITLIQSRLNQIWQENNGLLA
ncbi:TPA: type II toxin-antitoxin system HipA family toxin [Neisseria bacilliformis]|jgi:hipA family toxin-antitoxin system, toxin component|uniref:type II toxin-antitoxin system HipA family toxin n=1 Tax=Neisseria bacilliformis TaxID=267212 RepID=UPI0006692BEE|nr:type II toxin-antitoxin system HipA family toxin [Neisseria bacilliformis]